MSTASSVDESTKDPDMMSEADMKITPEMLEKAFERLDENGNNFISKREFFQGFESLNEDMNDPKEASRNTLNVLFNDLDKNNDGKLDIEEFKKLGSSRRIPSLIAGFLKQIILICPFFGPCIDKSGQIPVPPPAVPIG